MNDEEWNDGGGDFFDSAALNCGSRSTRKLKRELAVSSDNGDLKRFDDDRSAEDKAMSAAEARKKIAAIVKARSQKNGPTTTSRHTANKGLKAKQDAKMKRKEEKRDAQRMSKDKEFRREKLRAARMSGGRGAKDGEISIGHQMRSGGMKRKKK